jgi:chromosome segregation ATPase
MDFHDYAAQETSGLLARLLANRSDASTEQLRTVRDALEAATHALAAPPPIDDEVREVVARLAHAAAEQVRRVGDEAHTTVTALRGELDAHRTVSERLSASLAQSEAVIVTLRMEVDNERERANSADRDLAVTVEAHTEIEAAFRQAEAACRHETQAKAAVEQDLRESQGLLDLALGETAQVAAQLEHQANEAGQLRAQLEHQASEAGQLRAQLEHQTGETGQLRAQLERQTGETGQLRAELEHQTGETGQLRAELEHQTGEAGQLRAELEHQASEAGQLRAELEHQTGETGQLRAQLGHQTEEVERLRGELAALRTAHDELEAARQAIESARHHEASARSAFETELQEVRGLLDMALSDSARLGGELEQQTADSVTLRAELAKAREAGAERDAVVTQLDASNGRVHALESGQGRHEEAIRQLETALEHGRDAETRFLEQMVAAEQETTDARAEADVLRREAARTSALLDSTVQVVDELASVSTAPDLLSTLLHGLSVEFPRVALFGVKGSSLEGELQVGFDKRIDVSDLVFPLSEDSLLARAANSGVVARLTADELARPGAAPFGGTPSGALVLPIVLQGKPLAVVYAEESGRVPASPTSSIGFAKLLVSQTVVLLMRHTLELKTMNELREYAAMLLHEAEEMYTADSEAGKSEKELRARLKGNLDCATQLYAHRATLEGPGAALLLEEQIAAAIDAGTPFAGDLAVVSRPEEKPARRAAKVS